MENEKLGMGWYNFLRYFVYGFGRGFFLFIAFLSLCLLIIDYSPEMLFSFFSVVIATVFLFVVHRHLENYSDRILDIFLCVVIYDFVFFLFNVSDIRNSLPTFINNLLLYFINRTYFRNRSSLFVNKCNILGKPLPVLEKAPQAE